MELESFVAQIGAVLESAGNVPQMRRDVGKFALEAATVPEAERRAVIESRLPSREWPESEKPLARAVEELRADGAEVVIIAPDDASRAAITSWSPGESNPVSDG